MFDFEFPYAGAGQDDDLDKVKDMLWNMFNSVEEYKYNSGVTFSDFDAGISRQNPTLVPDPDIDQGWDFNKGTAADISKIVDIVVNNVPREYQNSDLTQLDLRPILIEVRDNPAKYGLSREQVSTVDGIIGTQTRSISNAVEHKIYDSIFPDGTSPLQYFSPSTITLIANNIASLPDSGDTSSLTQVTTYQNNWTQLTELPARETTQEIYLDRNKAPSYILQLPDNPYDSMVSSLETPNVEVTATGDVVPDRLQQLNSGSLSAEQLNQVIGGLNTVNPPIDFNSGDLQALARVNPDAIWQDALTQAQAPGAQENWLNEEFMFDPSPIWQQANGNYNVPHGTGFKTPPRNLLGMINLLYDMTSNELMALHDNLMLAGYFTQAGSTPLSKGDPSDPALKQAYRIFLSDVMASERGVAGELQYRQKQNADLVRQSFNRQTRSTVENGANAFAQAVLGRDLQTEELDRVVRIMKSLDAEEYIRAENPFAQQIGALRQAVESIDPMQAAAYAGTGDTSKYHRRYGTEQYSGGGEVRARFTAEDVEQGLIQQGMENSQ